MRVERQSASLVMKLLTARRLLTNGPSKLAICREFMTNTSDHRFGLYPLDSYPVFIKSRFCFDPVLIQFRLRLWLSECSNSKSQTCSIPVTVWNWRLWVSVCNALSVMHVTLCTPYYTLMLTGPIAIEPIERLKSLHFVKWLTEFEYHNIEVNTS